MSQRPSHANANKFPAKIILELTQKCRTSTQKKADDELSAAKKAALTETARKKHQQDVSDIAAAEDSLRQQDERYGTIPSESFAISLKKKKAPKDAALACQQSRHRLAQEAQCLSKKINIQEDNDSRGRRTGTSVSRVTGATSDDPMLGGEFGQDEAAETTVVARKSKGAGQKQQNNSVDKFRTTAQMGVKIQKVDVNDAIKVKAEPIRGKPLKGLKASDLPFTEATDHKTWDRLIPIGAILELL
ncbi:hypothetical protein BJ138DRAFT_1107668 [Hygrophoropsis aurantiaca]|uniref:Uncharacterized protein n=1 Tax=Hygrophoropsis aurantiaca TaxID=72124 RepID=A0ACB7ZQK8_9AGAM|nr:hypothetical protein BJ138DRAFT_1107668 [Hygrophoropsis aurantiaca]